MRALANMGGSRENALAVGREVMHILPRLLCAPDGARVQSFTTWSRCQGLVQTLTDFVSGGEDNVARTKKALRSDKKGASTAQHSASNQR